MKNILEYFEVTTEKFPDKTAVSIRNESISFIELKQKAILFSKKVSSTNKPIGVIANRDINTIVFFLAVLYSNNFYVPIDPDMPYEKVEKIIADSKMDCIFCTENNFSLLDRCNFDGYRISTLTTSEQINQIGINLSDNSTDMYMVYTSGSTGQPKGVLKTHRAAINYIDAFCDTFNINSEYVIGNQTPFFFDAATKDFLLMIKKGCTLEIIPTELFSMPTMLIEYMNEKKISYACWVPTALSLVAQLNPFSLVKPIYLRKMFFVGEVMPIKHLKKWMNELPEVEYYNLYGQSELVGICCYYKVTGQLENLDVLPIGKPLKNCEIYLINNDHIVNQENEIGEIYIVSNALAKEYFNDKDKTRESFVQRDFGDGMVRCFKTGDLGQYDADKNICFSSRKDYQIKHMGVRIELGEIETIAGSIDQIDRCCALYNSQKKKIILFCQLNKKYDMTGQEIRSILRTKLTSFMLPGKVVVLNSLPINSNGKIDRQALKKILT